MQVREVKTQGELVVVIFDDGLHATFHPYTHGWGYQIEGLRHFFLYEGERVVCQYNARLYRSGPAEDENQIVSIAPGWTPQRVAEYWRAAKKYTHEEYFENPRKEGREGPKELWYPWRVMSEGWHHLKMLEEGRDGRRPPPPHQQSTP